ncbi:MAG: class I SAM-dependent rRNA methyltransferase [Bacteriovoracaceae bacterium]
MRELKLKKDSFKFLEKGQTDFFHKEIDQSVSQFIPGEWVFIPHFSKNYSYVGMVNPFVDKSACLKIAGIVPSKKLEDKNESEFSTEFVDDALKKSIQRRQRFKSSLCGARLVYGSFDNLPGLIVDMYKDIILVQISTAGLDRLREQIKAVLNQSFSNHKVYFFDNSNKRSLEGLPQYDNFEFEKLENIIIEDAGIEYKLSRDIIQKNGYYFDHTPNRIKLERAINELDIKFDNGLDLFSYCGSWGMHLLRSGLRKVSFVDQSPIVESIKENVLRNSFDGAAQCVRSDVFKYLDECKQKQRKFDVIVSDPPAFSKGKDKKTSALRGYDSIHQKCVGLLNSPALFAVGSCTKNVDFTDLDQSVKKAFKHHGKKAQMIEMGIQGHDHPFRDFLDKGFYIKFILYLVD